MDKIRSLFLAANPQATERLSLDKEVREITAKLRSSDYRDSIELISVWAVRSDDLLQSLNTYRPQIVHFSGHGSSSGEIILVDSTGMPKPISTFALKKLFTALKDNIRLVILNACYSKIQAEAVTEAIDCAVGMTDRIGDEAAITFIASFYRAIGFGRSVQEAFEQGVTALLLEGISEEHIPELIVKKGVDPSLLFLASPLSSNQTTPPSPQHTPVAIQTDKKDSPYERKSKLAPIEFSQISSARQPSHPESPSPKLSVLNIVLWILQVLLATIFLLHGWLFVSPPAEMVDTMNASIPSGLRIFIGVSELLAVVGLILPGLARILPWIIPLTAAGLTIVMTSATILHLSRGEISSAVITIILLMLVAFVAYTRWKVKPIAPRKIA